MNSIRLSGMCLLSTLKERGELELTKGVCYAKSQGEVDSRNTQCNGFYQLW